MMKGGHLREGRTLRESLEEKKRSPVREVKSL